MFSGASVPKIVSQANICDRSQYHFLAVFQVEYFLHFRWSISTSYLPQIKTLHTRYRWHARVWYSIGNTVSFHISA